jgi:gamma-glutamyl hydrolase
VIGIYPTIPGSYLDAYKEWLTQEGADSLVLPESFAGQELEQLFQSINGFLIPGGGDPRGSAVEAMVQRAVQANRQGDYFPVWGTCLGFEWLVDIFGDKPIVGGFDSEELALPLDFTADAATSRLYQGANSSLMSWLASENITYNAHTEGITPDAFASNAGLVSTFKVLATDVDRQGRSFVSQIEGKALPIYGNQFHPEKVQFVDGDAIPRGDHAIAAARYLAQFFVAEAQKSSHQPGMLV